MFNFVAIIFELCIAKVIILSDLGLEMIGKNPQLVRVADFLLYFLFLDAFRLIVSKPIRFKSSILRLPDFGFLAGADAFGLDGL
jgi:hypothetical protein